MVTKTELTLYARTERLKDKITSYLQGSYIFYLHFAILIAMPIAFLTGCMTWYQIIYSSVPPEAKVFSLQLYRFLKMAFMATVVPTAVIYNTAVVLALLAVGINKLLQVSKPLQNRLMEYDTNISEEYKRNYKFIKMDDLVGLLKSRNYDLSPNSTISLLNSDDPRNISYNILLLASQAGAATIYRFIEAIANDRANVIAILRDDWQTHGATLLPVSRNKIASYINQSNMDSLIMELRATNGWGWDYKGENLLRKTRPLINAPTFQRFNTEDYGCLSNFISKQKNQLVRAAEKILVKLESNVPRSVQNTESLEPVETVAFVPQFSSRFPVQQQVAQVFDDTPLYDDEEQPLINSSRPRIT